MIRAFLVISLTLSASLPAQGLTGKSIVATYGRNGIIDESGFAEFVAAEILSGIDVNGDWPTDLAPSIQVEEFAAAWMHLIADLKVPIDCRDFEVSAAETEFRRMTSSDLRPADLAKSTNSLGTLLRARVTDHKSLIPVPLPTDATAIDAYLAARKRRATHATSLAVRIERLKASATNGEVSKDSYVRYAVWLRLQRADKDGSGSLDPWEFRSVLPATLDTFRQYRAWHGLVDPKRLLIPTEAESAELRKLGLADADKVWESIPDTQPKPLGELIEAETAAQEAKDKPPSRFLPSGFLLHPSPYVGDDQQSYPPLGTSAWYLKLRKDVRVPDTSSQPARLNWKKNGSDDSLDIDGALALEWRSPSPSSVQDVLVAARWTTSDITKGTTTTKTDVREYYAGWGLTLEAHRVRLGVVRSEDAEKNVTRDAVAIDYYPTFGSEWSRSGYWNPLVNRVLEYCYQPGLALELGHYAENEASVDELPSQSKAELNIGIRLLGQLTLQSRIGVLTDLEHLDRSFGFHQSTLSWRFFGSDNVVFTAGATTGHEAPSLDRVERYDIGLGVKF